MFSGREEERMRVKIGFSQIKKQEILQGQAE